MHYLMINLPFSGHTNPTLPLVRELVRRGHRVTYVNAEPFRRRIEVVGASFRPYRNFPSDPTEQEKKEQCFRAAYETALSLPDAFDALIYEMFFYPGFELAQRMKLPCVRQFSQPAWSEETWAHAPAVFRLSAKLIDRQVLNRQDAQALGLTAYGLHDGIIGSKPDLNIVYLPEQFQGCRESFDNSYLFIVPTPEAVRTDTVIPYEKMSDPIVYISLGSIISNRGFCRECIRAFGGKPFSVILNTGKVTPDSLGKLPANIYAYSFVPQLEVLAHADVFLTHCGMNSINEALYQGVPMVAMPFLNDQLTNARRIVDLGLGKRVRSFPSRGKELYRAVCEVYADTQIKENVAALSARLRQPVDWDGIIARIEALSE